MHIRWHLIFLTGIFLVALFGGGFFYHSVEGWSYLDSLYFIVMTATTVGYGDFFPMTSAGKIFTMFFSFFGIAIAFYLVSVVSSNVLKKHFGTKMGQIKKEIKKQEEVKEKVIKAKRKKKS